MQFNIGDEVTLINGVKAHIIDVVQEPISQNLVYVVDQPFVGDQDQSLIHISEPTRIDVIT